MKQIITWNGMTTTRMSGGDLYTKKLIELSPGGKTVILSNNSSSILKKSQNIKKIISDSKSTETLAGLITLYLKRTIKSIKKIKKDNQEYDIAISSSPFLFDILPLVFCKAEKKAIILFHTIPERKPTSFKTKFRFMLTKIENKISSKIIKKYFNIIIAGNEIVKKDMMGKFPDKDIILSHAGIDANKIDSYKKEKKDKNLACFIGRLTTQKGILDLIEITENLNEKNPKLKLILIGDGPDKKELIEKIPKKLKEKIIIKGFLSEDEKYKILKKSQFFFFPSYEEGWGIALAEALYCNCLCLCYKLPHYKGIFQNYPIYSKLGNPKEFAKTFEENKNKSPLSTQTKFIKKYNYEEIVKLLFKNLK